MNREQDKTSTKLIQSDIVINNHTSMTFRTSIEDLKDKIIIHIYEEKSDE